MFQWTKEVMDGYVRLMKSLSSKCSGSKSSSCSDRILTCRINSICSPAKVGLVVTDFNYQPGS